MNFIKKINIKILFVILSGLLVFNACVDKNDWGTDDDYNRMFRPTNLAVTSITATTGDLNFVAIPGTEYYQFEMSNDSLLFDEIIAAFDTTANSFTLTGLDGNTAYSLRIKAIPVDKAKGESEWASVYFKTRAEQIMETVGAGDVASRTVTLRWEAGATVTNFVINDADGTEVQNITITAEQMAAGELEVTGLSPETAYEALLMNGTKQRGSASFTTYPDVPEAEYYIRLQAGDVLTQEMFDAITASTVTVTFPAGTFFTYAETLTLPAGVSFNFFGLPGETKAILNLTQLELGTNHDYVKFANLDISGLVYDATGTPTGGVNSYFINQSGETNTTVLEFSNCLLHDFNNTPLRLKDSADKYIGTFNIDNCMVYNTPDSYYVINCSASNHVVDNISITNSTFYNIGRLFLHNKSNNSSVLIADCTFDTVVAAGRYFFDYSSSFGPSNGFTMRNCILGATQDATAKGIRFNGSPTVTNTYATSDFVLGGASISGLNSYSGASTDLFTDPANGDYSIADELFDGKTSAGDPRWYFQ
ncbi:DUF5123 domain-containing protein [Mangrovibacterium lignilyticum]|uniref:DUF5123 domain-containing protein n=1 Tax=Mangrovibacterium lignilyticum TaxID=2668052 RepID=UPI0013D11043|nr:DUF5123 domain-containing protein [Mangrovibacterium lignilyticum]